MVRVVAWQGGLDLQQGGLGFVAGRKINKSSTKHGARADSRRGPRTKVNAVFKEDISEKKSKWLDTVRLRPYSSRTTLMVCPYI